MAIVFTIITVVVLVVGAAGWAWYSKRKLHVTVGPELDAAVRSYDRRRQVVRRLRRRRKQHDALQLKAVSSRDRACYAATWNDVQGDFLNDPSLALNGAERLVGRVLTARGYPGEDRQEQFALLSGKHADSLAGFRAAQRTNRRAVEDPATIATEDLRQAMRSYLALFNELIADPSTETCS